MRRSRRPSTAEPRLLLATAAAAVVVVLGLIALADTGSYWFVAITLAAAIAAAAMLALDVGRAAEDDAAPSPPADREPAVGSGAIVPGPDFTGPSTPGRLLVVSSEPVDPRAILRAATSRDADLALDRLGVMVVSPEGFGHVEVTNDERHYIRARKAEEATVAGLRRAGIAAAGHVGDHDPACRRRRAVPVSRRPHPRLRARSARRRVPAPARRPDCRGHRAARLADRHQSAISAVMMTVRSLSSLKCSAVPTALRAKAR